MKKAYLATAVLSALLMTACSAEKPADEASVDAQSQSTTVLETDAQSQSYALGASMGMFAMNRFEEQENLGLEVDRDALLAGFQDALAENSQLTIEEIQTLTQASDQALRSAQSAKAEQAAQENIAKGEAFLAENAEKEGVMVTDSGLQYEVLEEGTGKSPAATDTVTVHYRGTLLDGTEFDSSYGRGEPASFPLNRVISGWTEGLQLMKEGAKYRFYIPSELAYGPRATGAITPNSTLIFDVELLEVVQVAE
uniref:FKBP-type peptidyl-prolyl cis-trans isomerase n=1 Tax=Ningiella ruwaisensis TaxID=2364274 RepID=UPI00109FE101|nr:FKBP-type peptidyl-prolyl cis-trans isomerase [Ningiella ruwaisensis]